jgi:hypothetical protein
MFAMGRPKKQRIPRLHVTAHFLHSLFPQCEQLRFRDSWLICFRYCADDRIVLTQWLYLLLLWSRIALDWSQSLSKDIETASVSVNPLGQHNVVPWSANYAGTFLCWFSRALAEEPMFSHDLDKVSRIRKSISNLGSPSARPDVTHQRRDGKKSLPIIAVDADIQFTGEKDECARYCQITNSRAGPCGSKNETVEEIEQSIN